jgi:hypothetical protein
MQYGANPNIQNNSHRDAYDMLERSRRFLNNDQYQQILNLLNSYQEVKEPEMDYY